MRSHRQVLRQIAEQNLDPKIAYVKGVNGSLVPKKNPNVSGRIETKKSEESLEAKSVVSEETDLEKVDEKTQTSEATEEKPKKKLPPKKKKSELATDE
jgi:hypothetical protein